MTVAQLTKRHPDIKFTPSNRFIWSPQRQTVYYDQKQVQSREGTLALLHELSHALLGHQTYELDIELMNMEVEAWVKTREIAPSYKLKVNEEHIDSCLETYRIWLYKRSRCPECENTSLQESESTYHCFNCGAHWRVAQTKSLQPRRMKLAFG